MLREIELSLARIHHLSFSRGPLGFLEVTWLLPASKMDPGAVGISRSHGCSCGTCIFGIPPASLDDFSSSLPLSQSLCPTRAAARTFPTLAGRTLDKEADRRRAARARAVAAEVAGDVSRDSALIVV